MKNIFLLFAIMIFIAVACQNNSNNQSEGKTVTEIENPEMSEEINALDSISNEIEDAKQQLEESSEKLDELIKNL